MEASRTTVDNSKSVGSMWITRLVSLAAIDRNKIFCSERDHCVILLTQIRLKRHCQAIRRDMTLWAPGGRDVSTPRVSRSVGRAGERSEERRVGKECRARGSRAAYGR